MALTTSEMSKKGILGFIKSANLNTTADQVMTLDSRGGSYTLSTFMGASPSTSTTIAAGGYYTGASKSGTSLLVDTTTWAFTTGTTENKLVASASACAILASAATIYLSLTTAQGSAATANMFVFGMPAMTATNAYEFGKPQTADRASTVRLHTSIIAGIKSANMNSTSDQPMKVMINLAAYMPDSLGCIAPTGSFTTCAGGIYTGASKSGTAIFASGTTYSGLNPGTVDSAIQGNTGSTRITYSSPLYLSLTTAQGSAATVDILVSAVTEW